MKAFKQALNCRTLHYRSMKQVCYLLLCALAVGVADPGKRTIRVMSYNTGLTSRIPYYWKRSENIGKTVSKTKPDFICLQEVCCAAFEFFPRSTKF